MAFDLSAAEAAPAVALAEGQALAEHAARRRVSLATTRSQLGSLFAKTGTARQVQLVLCLLGLGG